MKSLILILAFVSQSAFSWENHSYHPPAVRSQADIEIMYCKTVKDIKALQNQANSHQDYSAYAAENSEVAQDEIRNLIAFNEMLKAQSKTKLVSKKCK